MATKILNSGRIRKVTITEIDNEAEWNWPDPGCFEEYEPEAAKMKSTDEVFEVLDNVVQDWKKQLEVIVAEGLKTIKKTTREKKMKMKYLPGDGLIGGSNATLQARREIISEWKNDITAAIDATHKKLNKLGDDKIKGTDEAVKAVGLIPDKNENKCTTVSLDFNTLMRDLDALYAKYNLINNLNKIPIYNVQNDALNNMKNHSPFPWYKQLGLPAQPSMFDFPTPVRQTEGNNKNILSLLHDFVSDQKSQKNIMEDWKKYEETRKKKVPTVKKEVKTTRRGRDSVQKMKERREVRKYKQYLLREIVRKGETHFYLMKKEIEEPQVLEVEDIFADWNKNLREIKRPRKITPRVRKISHRAERKEMLKEAKHEAELTQGPLTYSQMLKKNLKIPVESPPVEEMFGPWMKNVEKMYKPSKATNAADDLEVFKNWNFIFEDKSVPVSITAPPLAALECGQPTVPRVTSKTSKLITEKTSKKQTLAKLNAKLLEVKKENKKPIISNAVAVRSNTDVVPYVERKPIRMDTLDKITPASSGFKPSSHSQRNIVVNDVPVNTFIGPINKPRIPTPPPMPNIDWKELLATPANKDKDATTNVPKKNYKTEEIFDQWRHIFIDVNKATNATPKPKRRIQDFKQDVYFMEWLRNLDEPEHVVKERRERKDTFEDKENKTPSPKSTKRAEKKLAREQFIAEDVTEIKDNRRNDFMKAKKIKEKKRTEASRNSLGKRVK